MWEGSTSILPMCLDFLFYCIFARKSSVPFPVSLEILQLTLRSHRNQKADVSSFSAQAALPHFQ